MQPPSDPTRLRMRVVLVVQAVLIVLLGVAVAALIPRALSYDDLLDDNLALRERVAGLDRRLAEIDRILMRLRLYDAQLDGLRPGAVKTPTGEHGPTVDDVATVDAPEDDAPVTELDVDFQLRPADAWADAVIARADTFLAVFEEAEPDLNLLVTELEDLRALDSALPSRWPTTGDLTSDFGYRRSPFGRRAQFQRGPGRRSRWHRSGASSGCEGGERIQLQESTRELIMLLYILHFKVCSKI